MGEPISEGGAPKTKERVYYCPKCGKFFRSENTFSRHWKAHQHDVEDIQYEGADPTLCGARCSHKLYQHGILHECVMTAHHTLIMQQHACNCGLMWSTGICYDEP